MSPAVAVVSASVLPMTKAPVANDTLERQTSASRRNAQTSARLSGIAAVAETTGHTDELLAKLQALEDVWWSRGKIHRVVLTGGPCAGKSTVMTDISQLLRESNWLVFTMPEIATEMFKWSEGKMWEDFAAEGQEDDRVWAELQVTLTKVQMSIEDSILQMAERSIAKRRHGQNPPNGVVILLDRGVVDNLAYCTKDAWSMVLEKLGTTTARLRDRRYDHVIHLVSAANGAEEFYTLVQAGNDNGDASARTEGLEEARELDAKTQEAWRGSKSQYIVRNEGVSFDQKRARVKDIMRTIIGEKTSEGVQRVVCDYIPLDSIRSLCVKDPTIPWNVSMQVTLTYLSNQTRLQKREMEGQATLYYHQTLNHDREVLKQYQIDSWTFQEKMKIAQEGRQEAIAANVSGSRSAGFDEFQEVKVDRVTFVHNDTLIRCHCVRPRVASLDKPTLFLEVMDPHMPITELPRWLHVRSGWMPADMP